MSIPLPVRILMMNKSDYLSATAPFLDSEWQNWVETNLERGISAGVIAETLLQHGFRAAAHALQGKDKQVPLPFIDLQNNKVVLNDKACDILFTCHSPLVAVIGNFLSPDECQGLIDLSENKFLDARVVDNATGEFVQHKHRTSMNASFARGEHDLLATIEARIANLLHWEVEKGEGIQVLRYQNGGEYKAHYDFFDASTPGGQKNIGAAGQRVGTFLMYLSDVGAGGATRFPSLNFEVRPKAGMALYFADLLPTGEPDKLSLHSSVPVVTGTKYIATKWLRENTYVSG